MQASTLNRIFEGDRLNRLMEAEALHGRQVYRQADLFQDIQNGIWRELRNNNPIDAYRRNLQRAYLDKMEELLHRDQAKFDMSDSKALARASLMDLQQVIKKQMKKQKDSLSKAHLMDAMTRIEMILAGKVKKGKA